MWLVTLTAHWRTRGFRWGGGGSFLPFNHHVTGLQGWFGRLVSKVNPFWLGRIVLELKTNFSIDWKQLSTGVGGQDIATNFYHVFDKYRAIFDQLYELNKCKTTRRQLLLKYLAS